MQAAGLAKDYCVLDTVLNATGLVRRPPRAGPSVPETCVSAFV
jgi:hypothetical protein